MASQAFLEKAYLAYFGRPVDPVGAFAFKDSTEAQVYTAFYESPESRALYGDGFGEAQINAIYQMLFGRQAEPAGLAYWANEVARGALSPAAAALGILSGALNQDAVNVANKLLSSHAFTAGLDTLPESSAYVGDAAANFAREFLKTVTTLPATQNQVTATIADLVTIAGTEVNGPGNLFTLTEALGLVTVPASPPTDVLYWGYNPHPHNETGGVDNLAGGNGNNLTNEGPADGGVPASEMLSFLTSGLGFSAKDAQGVTLPSFQALLDALKAPGANLTFTGIDSSTTGSGNGGTVTISVTSTSGAIAATAQVALTEQYFKFLHDVLFDAEGNSRLFMKSVSERAASTTLQLVPIVLTQFDNNGGTVETKVVTSARDDTIVAGRLELLHQAYIDAGGGYNILEVDAKGTYAQPKLLAKIQEIRVNDLPNFYTTTNGGQSYLKNTLVDDNGIVSGGNTIPLVAGGSGSDDSWLDLNRAIDIKKLVVTDQGNSPADGGSTNPFSDYSGNLNIVGVRNAATLRLEGGFNSGTTTIQYGQGQTGTLKVELALGDVNADINILQNAAVLNIDSQGVENHMHQFFAGGSVSRMIVTGTGVFAVDENLASSFNQGRPVIIDASANTGGLDVTLDNDSGGSGSSGDFTHYNVKVTGTTADDEITVKNIATSNSDGKVVVAANDGNNTIVTDGSNMVSITSGTGNDSISSLGGVDVTIVAGDGTNVVRTDGSETVDITTGVGNDTISAQDGTSVTIVAGAGNNVINANGAVNADRVVSIITGDGNDTITATRAGSVTIEAGNGTNRITVSASEIAITTGTGNDTLTLSGMDTVFDLGDDEGAGNGAGGFNTGNVINPSVTVNFRGDLAPGALLTLELGAGTNTINLGRDVTDLDNSPDVDIEFGLTALEGSVISGSGIRLFVENNSDLTQADLTGATITSVVLKQELRITTEQFTEIGASAFTALRDEEGATEDLYLVATSDVTLSDLVNLAQLSTAVRLHVELKDGATLSLTAAELHKHFAVDGVTSNDGLNGAVVITEAGLNYDAFATGNLATPFGVILGGTLSADFDSSDDVTITRAVTGFERPNPATSTDVLTINSDLTPVVETAIISEVATLKIVGDADISFDHAVDLGRDAIDLTHLALADGRAPDWVAPETDAFTIDFSALNGILVNMTVANFQDVKQIKGNGTVVDPVRLDVELTNGSSVGASGNNQGLKSTGVQTYVVTAIGDDSVGEDAAPSGATFYVCDLSADVTTLGLQGNYNDTILFKQVKWGTNFLLEAGGADKADGNPSYANIGRLHGEYFWIGAGPHAASVVNINNQGVALTKPINVSSIQIDYADSIAINVADGDVIINTLSGSSLNALTVTSADDVSIGIGANLLDGKIGSTGATTTSVIDGTAVAGDFVLNLTGDNNFSKAVLSGVDSIVLNDNVDLTLNADQVVAMGASIVDNGTLTTLSVTNFGTQAIDFTAIDVDALGTVTVSDSAASPIIVDAGTVFGNAATAVTELAIIAKTSDTTVEMTAAQFGQLAGAGTVTGDTSPSAATGVEFVAKLVLTAVPADAEIVLTGVEPAGADGVSVVVRAANIVATEDFSVTGHIATLETVGVVDLTGAFDITAFSKVNLAAGSVLTLTAAQVAAIGTTDANFDGVADNWTGLAGAMLHITEIQTGFALDLDALQAAGIDIGTLTLDNSDLPIVFGAATLGGADSIVTPTKGGLAGSEPVEFTTLTLTAAQFDQLDGTGTITGDGTVNITALKNNTDVNADNVLNAKDTVAIDVTGITAPKGTVMLGDPSVTLATTSSLAGFEIKLDNSQMIRFSTAAQASGAKITEVHPGTDVTAVAWLFTSVATPVNTSLYNSTINHLYILTTLADASVEESLWTTLAGSIVVEKFSESTIPDVLTGFARVNTFEALTSLPGGVNYDNQTLLESTTALTMNLEGNVTIGNVTVGDTVGTGLLQSLTINSYEDRSSLDVRGLNNPAYVFQPNIIGNIGLNAGSTDNLVNVTLNTYGLVSDGLGYLDVVNVNVVAAQRDGLPLQVGTITFGANATVLNPTTPAVLTLSGALGIAIGGVNIADAEVNLLDINATAYTGVDTALTIGGIVPTGGAAAGNALGSFDHIYVVDGYTAPAAPFAIAGNSLLVVTGGSNDFTAATAFDVDKVHFTANSTLTLTAAQVAAIGTLDGGDVGTAADQWSALAALNVTLNITELDGTTGPLLLNNIASAGINIGTVTIKDTNGVVTLDTGMNMGDADSIIVPAGTTLNLTGAQFDQLEGTGTITGLTATGQAKGAVNITGLVNTLDSNDTDTVADDYTFLDVTLVTATHGTITLGADDVSVGNIAANVHSILGSFSITLNDVNSNVAIDNELAGQTIRFSTAVQAERTITVINADNDGLNDPESQVVPVAVDLTGSAERDTNVIWLFSTITGTANAGKILTNGYDAELGRVWVNDALVNGQNVESIFSSPSAIAVNPSTGVINLNSSTIIRVANTAALSGVLPTNQNVSRVVEVESFTQLPAGLTFSNPDKLVGVKELQIDLGGAVTMGALSIDNIVAASTLNGDEFGTLTINSLLANTPTHYLLPEDWVAGVNVLPSTLTAVQQANTIGAISSGVTRGELARVTINTFTGVEGTGLNTGTITFVDDGGLTPADVTDDDPLALLKVTGDKNVNITSVDTTDTDITALTVDVTGYTGTLTAPGASPAFQLNNTQTLIFVNDGGAPESKEKFTLTLNSGMSSSGADSITFDGTTVTLAAGPLTAAQVATALAAGAYANWTAAVGAGTNQVVFTAKSTANVSDVTLGNFVLTDNGAGSVAFNATVDTVLTTAGGPGTYAQGGQDGTINLGTATNAGVAGNELSFIDASNFDGTLNLGILARLDSTDDDLNSDGDFNDTVGGVAENRAFTFTSGQGTTTATLAAANGLVPTLNAGSEWSFNYTGAAPGSYLKLTSSAVLTAGSTLRLTNVPLKIEGVVSLTQLVDNVATLTKTEGLFITGGSIEVLSGATLTLTAAQVDGMNTAGVQIVGAGTLKIIGDASGANYDDLGANVQVMTVDISGVTINGVTDLAVQLTLAGADDDANTLTAKVAQTVIGSPNADVITTGDNLNDDITGGGGNDTLNGGSDTNLTDSITDNNTFRVDAGTDTIVGLNSGDILVVAAGATANAAITDGHEQFTLALAGSSAIVGASDTFAFNGTTVTFADADGDFTQAAKIADASYADWVATVSLATVTFTAKLAGNLDLTVPPVFTFTDNAGANAFTSAYANTVQGTTDGFTATAATVNSGTVAISGGNVNISAATGSGVFNITGSAQALDDIDVLIGSSVADVINGGNTDQNSETRIDFLTGNGGNDVFEFNVSTSIPVALTQSNVTPGSDREQIVFTEATTALAGTITIPYTLNGVNAASPVTVTLLGGEDLNAIGQATAAAMSAVTGFTAVNVAGTVVIYNQPGTSLTIGAITQSIPANVDTITSGDNPGGDIAQVQRVSVDVALVNPNATALTVGEKYTVTFTYADEPVTTASFDVTVGETVNAVVVSTEAQLATALAFKINTALELNAVANVVGAFSYLDITDAVSNNGAWTVALASSGGFSGSGASVTGGGSIQTADVITDFKLSGADKIDLGLTAGSGSNYASGAQVNTYTDALTAANLAINGVVQYYLTSVKDLDANVAGDQTMGVLFFDANNDDVIDGVIQLVGINSSNFAASDIVA